jgi:hypothetical protein
MKTCSTTERKTSESGLSVAGMDMTVGVAADVQVHVWYARPGVRSPAVCLVWWRHAEIAETRNRTESRFRYLYVHKPIYPSISLLTFCGAKFWYKPSPLSLDRFSPENPAGSETHLDTLEASAQRCYLVAHLDFLSRPRSAHYGCNTDGASPRLRPRFS